MRNLLRNLKFILITVLLFTSCNDSFLDTKPLNEFSEVDLWQDPGLIESFVNGIYLSVDNPVLGGDGMLKGEFVDEAHDMWYSYFEFNNSLITSDDLQGWPHETWEKVYGSIRACNIFLEKIDQASFDNTIIDGKTLKERLTGEVHFLRAYFYHQLVSLYGGVPIISKSYGLNDDFKLARDSYADCIQFIVDECNKAASLLPIENSGNNNGRATKGAASALKSEVLLYAASDLHDNNPMFSGFSNPELLGYTSGDSHERWVAAKNAAKDVMDLGIYSLFKADPSAGDPISQNIIDLFISKRNEEDIFLRYFIVNNRANNLPLASGPNGYHLYGQNAPAGNLVDDYEMADGTRFDWNNPLHTAEPYKNRDPRFYATILYEGVKWRQRTPDGIPIDPEGVIQVGNWEKWDNTNNQKIEVFGLDTRNSPIEPWNGGYTGYYLRKFIDPTVDGQYSGQDIPWRFYRYGEILLNYAEACIELGEDGEARNYINMIRKRAGMPEVTESGPSLLDRYRQERRIELALEDHRFYDVRRWLIAPEAYVAFTGVNVLYKLNQDQTTATVPTITPIVVQTSAWLDKAYFFPIRRDEMNKNDLLIQNPGY